MTEIRLYNTATRSKEELTPIVEGKRVDVCLRTHGL